jgi:hypothetical protein
MIRDDDSNVRNVLLWVPRSANTAKVKDCLYKARPKKHPRGFVKEGEYTGDRRGIEGESALDELRSTSAKYCRGRQSKLIDESWRWSVVEKEL